MSGDNLKLFSQVTLGAAFRLEPHGIVYIKYDEQTARKGTANGEEVPFSPSILTLDAGTPKLWRITGFARRLGAWGLGEKFRAYTVALTFGQASNQVRETFYADGYETVLVREGAPTDTFYSTEDQ